jgi:hypothetical protein
VRITLWNLCLPNICPSVFWDSQIPSVPIKIMGKTSAHQPRLRRKISTIIFFYRSSYIYHLIILYDLAICYGEKIPGDCRLYRCNTSELLYIWETFHTAIRNRPKVRLRRVGLPVSSCTQMISGFTNLFKTENLVPWARSEMIGSVIGQICSRFQVSVKIES